MENSAVLSAQHMNLYYGTFQALKDVSLTMDEHAVTALIGPSGCGKSTFIKTLNRMNDLIPGVRVEGTILYRGRDIFDKDLDVTLLRKRIGMVFQKPNPFPMTVYDNVAYGPRLHGVRGKKELDAATLNRLIKEIVVHERIDEDKTRHSSIEIHFNLKPIPEVEQVTA